MRRGFKTEAKRLALDLRAEIGLSVTEAFNPYDLASLYGIQVFRLTELGIDSTGSTALSGALLAVGTGRVILENDTHAPSRCKLTVSHEMSHVALEHEFPTLLVDEKGCRELIGDQEDEATFLAGELVLPSDTAIKAAFGGKSDAEVALIYGISVEAARWRMNSSGARRIAARSKASRWH